MPGLQTIKLTDAEIIRDYILPARAWVERGGPDGNGPRGGQRIEPAMSRAEAGSTTDQTQTANFKRWYGDWQNAGQGAASNDSTNLDARGNQDIDPLQRHRGVGANPDGATRVGDFTFPGASGPVGRDGAPARFFHGTRDDFTTFDGRAATRKDNGWLPKGMAQDIYISTYIKQPRYDQVLMLSPAVGTEIVDSGVNAGPGRASKWFQQSLNDLSRAGRDYPQIAVDGAIGHGTLAAYRALEKKRGRIKACELTLKLMDSYQAAHYANLAKSPAQASFLVGWLDHRIGNVNPARCAETVGVG